MDILNHPLMQRLRHIKQVGLASIVYPGAQHTRFQHSLGAFYLMSEAIVSLQQKGIFIFDSEVEALRAAILMHDIGHGPFSHVLENTLIEWRSEPCSECFQKRISQAFPPPVDQQSTRHGPPGLPAPRQFLHWCK